MLVSGNDFYCGNSSSTPCQLALKNQIPSQYVHPSTKQCNYSVDLSNCARFEKILGITKSFMTPSHSTSTNTPQGTGVIAITQAKASEIISKYAIIRYKCSLTIDYRSTLYDASTAVFFGYGNSSNYYLISLYLSKQSLQTYPVSESGGWYVSVPHLQGLANGIVFSANDLGICLRSNSDAGYKDSISGTYSIQIEGLPW